MQVHFKVCSMLNCKTNINVDFFGRCCLVGLLALTLVACDAPKIEQLEEGVSTEAQVRTQFGEPELVWDNPDGSITYEYSRQPEGHRNYMVTIGTDGKMTALRQVLQKANFDKITVGTRMEDVRRALGKPAKQTPFVQQQENHWDYRHMDTATNQSMIFTIVFDPNMVVKRTGTSPDPSGPDSGRTGG
jgi:outer membrane protein assembly factor BamE (lipoprotein component of BamABCDE complex)